jgi:hypothetical protein
MEGQPAAINPTLVVVRTASGADRNELVAVALSCCPTIFSKPGQMSMMTARFRALTEQTVVPHLPRDEGDANDGRQEIPERCP